MGPGLTPPNHRKMSSKTQREVNHTATYDGQNFHPWKLIILDVLLEQHSLTGIMDGTDKLHVEV